MVAGAIAANAGNKGIERAVQSAGGTGGTLALVHPSGEDVVPGSRVALDDVRRAIASANTLTIDIDGGVVRLQPVQAGSRTSVVEIFIPDSALEDGVARDWWTLVGIALGLVAGSIIVVDRLARGAVDSAGNLVRAATAVGDGDLGVRIQPSGPRELAETGYAFNRMADRLVASRTTEREMVADLSHRLRTPLTVLRLDADALDSDDTSMGTFSPGRAGPQAHHPADPASHRDVGR
jgi:signal transduction histidine kinase